MIVTASIEESPFKSIQFKFAPADESELDPRAGTASFLRLQTDPVMVELLPTSRVKSVQDIHPDLVVLAVLLIVGQTKVKCLELPVQPSTAMVETVGARFQIDLVSAKKDSPVPSQRVGSNIAGLAFSGGVDSCAAHLLLPANAVSVFMNRVSLDGERKGLYNSSAAMASVDALQQSAFRATALRSNVENIRNPVGFPVDWSNSLPLVVNAGTLGLSSISFGTVLESATSIGKNKYSDMRKRTIFSRWAPIFDVAGVSMSLPVASLSEVLTSKIVREYGGFMRPQSCVRGTPGEPCRKCFKCFRKMVTEWALGGRAMNAGQISAAARTREVSSRLKSAPIHHEVGLAWAVSKVDSDNSLLMALAARGEVMRREYDGLEFLERPLDVNIDRFVPASIRGGVRSRIAELIGDPNPDDLSTVESWDIGDMVEGDSYQEGVSRTISVLNQIAQEGADRTSV